MDTVEKIEYIKDEISQALFFLEHQSLDFPAEAMLRRALELRELQAELKVLLADREAERIQAQSEREFV